MFFPYEVDVPTDRPPVTNYLLILATIAVFILQAISPVKQFEPYVLDGWSSPLRAPNKMSFPEHDDKS